MQRSNGDGTARDRQGAGQSAKKKQKRKNKKRSRSKARGQIPKRNRTPDDVTPDRSIDRSIDQSIDRSIDRSRASGVPTVGRLTSDAKDNSNNAEPDEGEDKPDDALNIDWDLTPEVDYTSTCTQARLERCVRSLCARFDTSKARSLVDTGHDGPNVPSLCAFSDCNWSGPEIDAHVCDAHSESIDECRAEHSAPADCSALDLYRAALTRVARSNIPLLGPHMDRRCHENCNKFMSNDNVRAGVCFCCARVLLAETIYEKKVVCGELTWVRAWNEDRTT